MLLNELKTSQVEKGMSPPPTDLTLTNFLLSLLSLLLLLFFPPDPYRRRNSSCLKRVKKEGLKVKLRRVILGKFLVILYRVS